MTVAANRQEQVGAALEAELRSRIKSRSWYRAHRANYHWSDFERDNDVVIRLLFSIRRDAIREEQAIDRAMKAHHEAVEAEEWRESVAAGQYLPDVPLAAPRLQDPGDHYVGMPL